MNIFNRVMNLFNTKIENTECKMETNIMNGFKIDRKKWKAALDEVLAKREAKKAETEKKYWSTIDYYFDSQLTKLYSIRAHARGRLHRRQARLNYTDWRMLPSSKVYLPSYAEFTQSNGEIKFDLTLADQAAYIGDSWKAYEKQEVIKTE